MAGGVRRGLAALSVVLVVASGAASAGEADVIGATSHRSSTGLYDFDVTVRSRDTGWDHYADRIDILAPDGSLLGTRVLEHPHENEQPFTRDVPQVRVPGDIDAVSIRVHVKPVGFDGATFTLPLKAQ